MSNTAYSQPTLTLWSGRAQPQLEQIARRFSDDTGIRVKIESPADMISQFEITAAAGQGPDIVLWAHDRLGDWHNAGLLASPLPDAELRDRIDPLAWQAVTIDNQISAYPLLMEAVSLVYNKALVAHPISDFSQWPALQQQLEPQHTKALMWDYTNPYYSWPLLASQGAQIFIADELGETGLDHSGAVKAGQQLRHWISSGLMPEDAQYSHMMRLFVQGKLAMMINGPWCWRDLDRYGIDYGIAPLPALEGRPARPFVGVFAAAINHTSEQQLAARTFIEEHLLSSASAKLLMSSGEGAAPVQLDLKQSLLEQPRMAGLYASLAQGEPMPNDAAMGQFWHIMSIALSNIGSGRQPVNAALQAAAARMRQSMR